MPSAIQICWMFSGRDAHDLGHLLGRGVGAGGHVGAALDGDGESVHPSLAAAQERKRKQKEMEKVSFAGKKITFE